MPFSLHTPSKPSLTTTWLWVTLIEVLFAIIIFWTWILIIMRMITSNIWWLYDIRNRDTALAIAKEWIDIVYHVRDSNLERWQYWHCAQIDLWAQDSCWRYFYDDSWLTRHIVDFDPAWLYTMETFATTGDAQIYYHEWIIFTEWWSDVSWFWYNHDAAWWSPTLFTRIIEFSPVSWYESFTWSVLQVDVRVLYWPESDRKEVALESIVGNIR